MAFIKAKKGSSPLDKSSFGTETQMRDNFLGVFKELDMFTSVQSRNVMIGLMEGDLSPEAAGEQLANMNSPFRDSISRDPGLFLDAATNVFQKGTDSQIKNAATNVSAPIVSETDQLKL